LLIFIYFRVTLILFRSVIKSQNIQTSYDNTKEFSRSWSSSESKRNVVADRCTAYCWLSAAE